MQEYKLNDRFFIYCRANYITIVGDDDKRVAIIYKFNTNLDVGTNHEFILMLKPVKLNRLENMYTHIKQRYALICKFIINNKTNETDSKSIVIVNIHLDSISDSHLASEHNVDARTTGGPVWTFQKEPYTTGETIYYTGQISYHKTQLAHILHNSTLFSNGYVIAGDTNYRSKYDASHKQDLFQALFKNFNNKNLNNKLIHAKDVCLDVCDTLPTQSFSRMHEKDIPHMLGRVAGKTGLIKNTAKLDIMVSDLNFDSTSVIDTNSSDHSYILGTIKLQNLMSIARDDDSLMVGSKKRNTRKSKKSKKQRRPTKKTRHTKKRRQTKTKSKKYKKSKKILFQY